MLCTILLQVQYFLPNPKPNQTLGQSLSLSPTFYHNPRVWFDDDVMYNIIASINIHDIIASINIHDIITFSLTTPLIFELSLYRKLIINSYLLMF